MRNFDSTLYAEFQKEIMQQFFMLEFQFSTTNRFTECDIDIYHEGSRFYPRRFSFDNLAGSTALSVDTLDVDIDDTDQTLSAVLLGEDVRNKTAILYIGVIADSAGVKSTVCEELMRYVVGGWQLCDDNTARINLTNELVLWNRKPLRTQSASCQWTFRGTECAYAGSETWCDKSYERCAALSNQVRFIGNRFLPALMKETLWWGRTPTYSGS